MSQNPIFSSKEPVAKDPAGAEACGTDEPAILVTRPEKASFSLKYFLAITPCILVLLSILLRTVIEATINSFSSTVGSSLGTSMGMYGSFSSFLPGSLGSLNSILSDGANITILMIAPVGIFIVFAAIGWSLRVTELWTGTALSLGLACLFGYICVLLNVVPYSGNTFLLFLQWTAFLIQPFSILATILVLFWLDRFRKSIRYTISESGIFLCGGVWKKQEHLLPHSQVGRVVLEQDFLGVRYNYGTVIPVSNTRWGAETSLRGIGAMGQKDNFGGGILFAKGREEASRYPLDCLYGIPNPKEAQRILTGFMARKESLEEEQVAYLKKIYEKGMAEEAVVELEQKTPTPVVKPEEKSPVPKLQGGVIRVTDEASLVPESPVWNETVREIPPVKKPEPSPIQLAYPSESIPDQIRKLAELRDSGILTEEEFSEKKAELLKRL